MLKKSDKNRYTEILFSTDEPPILKLSIRVKEINLPSALHYDSIPMKK